jgi:L-2-hydroxycarboxylate dehydrogenase (NAD+)
MTSISPEANTVGSAADRRLPAALLRAFAAEVFAACGLPQADAAEMGRLMVEADLIGSDAHGIFRLAQYAQWLRSGTINPRADIRVEKRSPATALIDGDNGMGHLVMAFAARTAVDIARASGIAWVGARRSNHAGAGALYSAIPVEHDMVAIYMAVSSANHMAPWGGAEPLMGTNPIAIGIPAGEEPPIMLDMATSVASFGKIRTHALENKPLPEGWMVNRNDGQPLTDASRIKEGLLLPIGGYKGSGLALAIGLLAGPLNGAAFGRDVREFSTIASRESNTGQSIIALDIARFVPLEAFKAEIDRHIRELRSSARLPGVDAIHIPGEQAHRRRRQREQGVPLSAALIAELDKLAQLLGLELLTARSR